MYFKVDRLSYEAQLKQDDPLQYESLRHFKKSKGIKRLTKDSPLYPLFLEFYTSWDPSQIRQIKKHPRTRMEYKRLREEKVLKKKNKLDLKEFQRLKKEAKYQTLINDTILNDYKHMIGNSITITFHEQPMIYDVWEERFVGDSKYEGKELRVYAYQDSDLMSAGNNVEVNLSIVNLKKNGYIGGEIIRVLQSIKYVDYEIWEYFFVLNPDI